MHLFVDQLLHTVMCVLALRISPIHDQKLQTWYPFGIIYSVRLSWDSPAFPQAVSFQFKQVDAFALDVEHHTARSYLGIMCLIQISTGELISLN